MKNTVIIKIELGEKRISTWVIFTKFINKDLSIINEIKCKYANINLIYFQKSLNLENVNIIMNIIEKIKIIIFSCPKL